MKEFPLTNEPPAVDSFIDRTTKSGTVDWELLPFDFPIVEAEAPRGATVFDNRLLGLDDEWLWRDHNIEHVVDALYSFKLRVKVEVCNGKVRVIVPDVEEIDYTPLL